MQKQITVLEGRPSLLLHSCCAPCSSAALERLCPHFDVTILYYNPNIQPEAEFFKRLLWQKKLLELLALPVRLLEAPYRGEDFQKAAAGLEGEPEGGARCTACFSLRLEETAKTAQELGFDYFCTTLSVSPHKDAARINVLGAAMGARYGVRWLCSDFKKSGGYARSIALSRELGLYRQKTCGCVYSKNNSQQETIL
ncbi:MAG: epoxyqueuosine reductase QueH [Firmicutes bacterium]|nr:epoxyqueuosine reductase QueH [Bacillota bacterium]